VFLPDRDGAVDRSWLEQRHRRGRITPEANGAEVINPTRVTRGQHCVTGMTSPLRDRPSPFASSAAGFTVGGNLAATPGKVVFRDALMELMQYAPSTAVLDAEPVLIVPAWTTKYYILDLLPANSLILWLVSRGRTVFVISWRNPGADLHDSSLEDYRVLGIMAAIDAVRAICNDAKIHAAGYCLGGTLLSIAAAAMARDGDDRLASLSLFAAQTDFTESGALQPFISEDQLNVLCDITQAQGYLDSAQVSGAFHAPGSNDLVWNNAIREYLLGEHDASDDLLAWNADGPRLPPRMHIEYLRHLFLHNDLAEGRFRVGGHRLTLNDLNVPMFVLATERDHVARWRSVFRLHLLNDGELTFVLTSGGHNAGIVSEPGHENRHFRIRVRTTGARALTPDEWERDTVPTSGSWWLAWGLWLDEHSSGPPGGPPPMGAPEFPPICDAPGAYVLEA
jgi:polyhydroxyalkanoate synthase subunit PhaC